MAYIHSLFSTSMLAACFLSNSLCFGEIEDTIKQIQNEEIIFASLGNYSDLQATEVPAQWSENHLAFTFDASKQTNASGTFRVFVSFPDGKQFFIDGIIGPGGVPVTFQVGPPSLVGKYTITFSITSLEGILNPQQGPFGIAQNLTNGHQSQTTFDVSDIGDEAPFVFRNRHHKHKDKH